MGSPDRRWEEGKSHRNSLSLCLQLQLQPLMALVPSVVPGVPGHHSPRFWSLILGPSFVLFSLGGELLPVVANLRAIGLLSYRITCVTNSLY